MSSSLSARAAALGPLRRRSAFTLIEMMVVLLIIGTLLAFFVAGGSKLFRSAASKETAVRIRELSSLLEQFRVAEGDYPTDMLPSDVASNAENAQAEALFLAFFSPGYGGQRPDEDWLVNTDGDSAAKGASVLPTRELFEIGDSWGNPIVYFDSRHYATPAIILAGPLDGEPEPQQVLAQRNPRTGSWRQSASYQLLSAGEDGVFGTEDDITNSGGG